MADFTIQDTTAVDGKHIWQITDSRADKLYGRHIKQTISKVMGAPSPFCLHLLVGQERLDDFHQLKDTTTQEIEIGNFKTDLYTALALYTTAHDLPRFLCRLQLPTQQPTTFHTFWSNMFKLV